jgi:hypothetical protein
MTTAVALQLEELPANDPQKPGPRTVEGKKRSALNATRHGILSQRDVLPWEDQEDFDAFVDVTLDYFRVTHPFEERLVRRLAALQWRLQRLQAYEHVLAIDAAVSDRVDIDLHTELPRPLFRTDAATIRREFDRGTDLHQRLEETYKVLSNPDEKAGKALIPGSHIRDLWSALKEVAEFAEDAATGQEQESPFSWTYQIESARAALNTFLLSLPPEARENDFDGEALVEIDEHCRVMRGIFGGAIALYEHLMFLKRVLSLAKEREYWTSGRELAKASVPSREELDKLIRYGRHLDLSIREVLGQIEACRRLSRPDEP